MILALAGLLVCLFLSGTFSGMETGIYSLERVRLQVRAAQGDRRAARLLALVARPAAAVCAILVINNVVNYLVALSSGHVLRVMSGGRLGDLELELLNTVSVVPVLFVLGELVPKTLFLRHPSALVALAQPLFSVGARLAWPVVVVLTALGRRLEGKDERGGLDRLFRREALVQVLTTADEAEGLNRSQRELAERVLELRNLRVREHMRPIESVVAVRPDAGSADVLEVASRTQHSRLFVRSADGGGFEGFINVLDAAFSEEPFDVRRLLHPLAEVRPDQPIGEALAQLQRERRPLALVRGPRGLEGLIGAWDVTEVLITRPPLTENGAAHRR